MSSDKQSTKSTGNQTGNTGPQVYEEELQKFIVKGDNISFQIFIDKEDIEPFIEEIKSRFPDATFKEMKDHILIIHGDEEVEVEEEDDEEDDPEDVTRFLAEMGHECIITIPKL